MISSRNWEIGKLKNWILGNWQIKPRAHIWGHGATARAMGPQPGPRGHRNFLGGDLGLGTTAGTLRNEYIRGTVGNEYIGGTLGNEYIGGTLGN